MRHIITLALMSLSLLYGEERTWIGISTHEYSEGKLESYYAMGTIDPGDLAEVKKGAMNEAFVEIRDLCFLEEDNMTVTMNDEDPSSKEETNVKLIRVKVIDEIALLKGDPRMIYGTKSEKP
jgi:hypothetical protein